MKIKDRLSKLLSSKFIVFACTFVLIIFTDKLADRTTAWVYSLISMAFIGGTTWQNFIHAKIGIETKK